MAMSLCSTTAWHGAQWQRGGGRSFPPQCYETALAWLQPNETWGSL